MSERRSRALPGRVLSKQVTDRRGRPALMIEAIPVRAGQRVRIVFESVGRDYPQGVFVATEGELREAGSSSRAFALWYDNAPAEIEIEVVETAGTLVLYNIWDQGRHAGFDSQAYTSGMVAEDLPGGWTRYSCKDYGFDEGFDSVVFRILVED